jgi:hypothetical protein
MSLISQPKNKELDYPQLSMIIRVRKSCLRSSVPINMFWPNTSQNTIHSNNLFLVFRFFFKSMFFFKFHHSTFGLLKIEIHDLL